MRRAIAAALLVTALASCGGGSTDTLAPGSTLRIGYSFPFDTADLAEAAGCPRRLAQQMTYCLRAMGALAVDGRRGRAVLYRRTMCYDISR